MIGLVPEFAVPCAVTLVFIAALRPTARYVGLVDRPGGRKTHGGDVPLVGGICMFAGLAIGAGSFLPLVIHPSLLLGASLLAIVGTLDDLYDVRPAYRLVAQACAGLIAILGGVQVQSLGVFGGEELTLGLLSIPFTLLTMMSFSNALNWQDGKDGLAGGQTLVVLMALLVADLLWGQNAHAEVAIALIGCVVAFLAFNAPIRSRGGAKLFMGDAGAQFLGFSLSWIAILMTQAPDPVIAPVTALWIGAVPILDFFGSMVRRIATGRRPMSADSEHLHHLLARAGLSRRGVVAAELAACVAFATIGLTGEALEIGQGTMLALMGVVAGLYYWVFCSGCFFQRRGDPSPELARRWFWPEPPPSR